MLAIDTYTINEGIMVKKAIEEHIDMKKRKIIIANKASFNGAFIDEGKLSLTGNHKFYIIGKNLELLIKIFNFKIIDIIGHYTKYGQDFLDNEAFKYIPDIRKLDIKDINELQFYKLIGLTDDEIKLINKSLNIENEIKKCETNIINKKIELFDEKPKKKQKPIKKVESSEESDSSEDEKIEEKPKKIIKTKKIELSSDSDSSSDSEKVELKPKKIIKKKK